jgi:hypothetical protein
MQIKRGVNPLDSLVYVIACILTLGGAWALRVIISKAIMDAVEG